ncbi:Protein kinase-like (PK-like) [Glarea lozoyensis ATCC 20868]|uniref:Protein kinase-like (PK-like) n=1 Tax=Glarea lozoyensis (strain ATCC 20868 / MF5171) TaxID=1116229 RepID=S3CMZ9_GLAL2|nr:Protein kinase-like (PK-like) [Glarea lozoyensis ATCC 20868]EPE27100.1 Protein kinase-like (PK-like) [Glarea lozoyensis ATCC 20868]
MTSVMVPYYAQPDELPCPLPTKQQIHSSEEIFLDYGEGRKVVGFGHNFVVKYGLNVELIEGENMLFIAQLKDTSVRAPKVYALYEDPKDEMRYIVMERITGVTLLSVWSSLEAPQKEAICAKLRRSMDTLRKLPSPGGYCSIGRRPLEDCMFWTSKDSDETESPVEQVNGPIDTPLNGPFDTEEEVNSAMIKKYLYNNAPRGKAVFYERALPKVLCNHPPVFTHGDLQRKNIMINRIPDIDKAGNVVDEELEVVLIDWEVSGWYPSYWEHSRAMQGCGRFEDDWHYWLGQILDEYLTIWAWTNMMFLELWS